MTPRLVDVARERWRLIVTGLLLGVVAAGLTIQLVPRAYSASVTMILETQPADPTLPAPTAADEVSAQRINTYVQLMESKRLASDVVLALHLPVTPEQLASRIVATTRPSSALITAAVTYGSPDQAVTVANAIGAAFIKHVEEIEQPADPTRRPAILAKVFQAAQPPADLVAPQPLLYLVVDVVLGLLLGCGAAVLRDAVDPQVKSRNQLEEIFGVPVLGVIGHNRKIRAGPLKTYGASNTPLAETFGHLRTNVLAGVDRKHTSVLVTSATSAEGVTTTVCNLGLSLAKAGAHVVIVDANLRSPSVAACLGVGATPGLTDVLDLIEPLNVAVRPVGPALDALPSGPRPPNPSELLGSKPMTDLLASLREKYDVVLIDAPPLLPVTDAAVLAPRVDAILVVVRYGRTHLEDALAARAALHAVSGQILGSVLTMARHESSRKRAELRPVGQWWRRQTRQPQDGTPPESNVPMVPTRTVTEAYARPSPQPRPRPRVDPGPHNDDPAVRSSAEKSFDRGSAAG